MNDWTIALKWLTPFTGKNACSISTTFSRIFRKERKEHHVNPSIVYQAGLFDDISLGFEPWASNALSQFCFYCPSIEPHRAHVANYLSLVLYVFFARTWHQMWLGKRRRKYECLFEVNEWSGSRGKRTDITSLRVTISLPSTSCSPTFLCSKHEGLFQYWQRIGLTFGSDFLRGTFTTGLFLCNIR